VTYFTIVIEFESAGEVFIPCPTVILPMPSNTGKGARTFLECCIIYELYLKERLNDIVPAQPRGMGIGTGTRCVIDRNGAGSKKASRFF